MNTAGPTNKMLNPGYAIYVMLDDIDNQPVYRGVPLTKTNNFLNARGPTWFSMDREHDFIALPGYQRIIFKLQQMPRSDPPRLINLQNELVREVLNRAIDRLTKTDLEKCILDVSSLYGPKPNWFKDSCKITQRRIITINEPQFKSQLKSVYGGISFIEQMKTMEDGVFAERMNRTGNLSVRIKTNITRSNLFGYRYSTEDYDRALVILICTVFINHHFFKNVVGWVHEEWETAWHDKYKSGSHKFKHEMVIYNASTVFDVGVPDAQPNQIAPIQIHWNIDDPMDTTPGGGGI